jgi:hypothetical protein
MDLKCEYFDYKKDLDKQRELFADAFAEVPDKSIESYNWQFRQFPNIANSSFEYCSYIEDEMIGYYAAVPYRYKIMNSLTDVGMVCGVMTSTKHRGKGIFTQMGKYSTAELAKSVPFTTGYPIRQSVIPGHLKVGWKIAFELPLYSKLIRSNSVLATKKISFLSYLVNPFLSLYNFFLATKSPNVYSADFYTEINSIEGYDEFVKEWVKSVPNALIKDSEFAKWRYSRPWKNYSFLVIKKNKSIVGFTSFCSVIKEGIPSYGLLDLMILPQYADCLGYLYKNLYTKAKSERIEAIMFMMSKHSAKQYKVIKNGYLRSPYKFSLIIKNLTNQFQDDVLFKEENWHLMWVDSDDL